MIDPSHLSALNAVVQTGSFDLAAGQLSVTASAVSQRIKALEDHIGAPVVIRSQPCVATQIGARLIRHYQDIAVLEAKALRDTPVQTPRQQIRIAANADSLATWLLPALAQSDDLLFDITIDDQDHSARWLRSGDVAAAITSRADPVQGCDCTPLGVLPYVATASPDFMARHFADGVDATSLAAAPALTFNAMDALQRRWVEKVTGQRVALPTHHLASSHGFVEACLLGMGWGLNPTPLVQDHLDTGRLVALANAPFSTPLYWQVSRLLGDALSPLTKHIKEKAARTLTAF
ncbi:LysR family transcriptional regulator ArgP [Nereida sp. MMG025]|uniref:LysR family transcriptional regulator ArgP n=1 Tax=Nereida sp. MMG025 TaxID=2909981 RepID=UPI001F298C18|nr:LysR family transcriptional regulator ArgP [Nereida sp. MMG025]MCF6443931.1 LysR family transcriptional regulator ArgP [Nereida sp. MMG025]